MTHEQRRHVDLQGEHERAVRGLNRANAMVGRLTERRDQLIEENARRAEQVAHLEAELRAVSRERDALARVLSAVTGGAGAAA